MDAIILLQGLRLQGFGNEGIAESASSSYIAYPQTDYKRIIAFLPKYVKAMACIKYQNFLICSSICT